MRTVTDDLGQPVPLSPEIARVVSLVPSLTESIAATRSPALIGATDWCTHPAGLDVERIRGTKNPDVGRIIELGPDLVIANQEENRRRDVETLRAAGIPVWVTVTEDVPQALRALNRLFTEALDWGEPDWLAESRRQWDHPVPPPTHRVAIPIWRDPWMVVGRDTFTGDLAARLGLANVFADQAERYPHTSPEQIIAHRPDLILLPDEPYRFTAEDGPEVFPATRSALVEGRALTWYGPSLTTARATIRRAVGHID